jgi:hypothetical protein
MYTEDTTVTLDPHGELQKLLGHNSNVNCTFTDDELSRIASLARKALQPEIEEWESTRFHVLRSEELFEDLEAVIAEALEHHSEETRAAERIAELIEYRMYSAKASVAEDALVEFVQGRRVLLKGTDHPRW